jgi:hypothetical protein
MNNENEFKERTVWRKYLHHESSSELFGETFYAGVFCVREVSGYAIWYRRWLRATPDDTLGGLLGMQRLQMR